MSDDNFDFAAYRYIKTRGADDKRPLNKWGGYSQDFDEASRVYTYEDVTMSPHDYWAIVDIENPERATLATLIFDLDIYKADDSFDPDDIQLPDNAPLVKSQRGGYHLYFAVHCDVGELNESDFEMTADLSWDIDIRGSAVSMHVVAPSDIPGVESSYELVNDTSIKTVFDPADAAEQVRYKGEPLLEYSPDTRGTGPIDIDRDVEPPEEMPTCYHRGLQVRQASPEDDDVNSHKVNVLTALCGLYAGYDTETVVEQFMEYAPDSPDREKTEYQVNHIAQGIDAGNYSPPSNSTLRNYGILSGAESCMCDIEYHGGGGKSADLDPKQLWQWWSGKRQDGELTSGSIIPERALWHIAEEFTEYPLDEVPDDVEKLPAKAHNRALYWVNNIWPEEEGVSIPMAEDEPVTERPYRDPDPANVHTWEDVLYVYDESKEDGRFATVKLLRKEHEFLTPEDTDNLHVYDDDLGIFDKTAKYLIGRKLDRELDSHYSQHEKTEIIGRLKEDKVERDDLEAGAFEGNYVCAENGVVDIDNRELLDHDPEFMFTTRHPQKFDPEAEPTRIEQFLDEITRREEDAQTMIEMLGNCLLPNYDYESFMVLFGEGSNGKSTWFEVCREWIGDENVESMTLQQITDNRFAASNLVGKWANIGEDLPARKIHDLGTLKDLTGGGETWVEPKGKDGFSFRNRAKMMFAANDPPVLGERTKAVARRIVPIKLPYQFTTDPDDGHKDAQKEGLLDELTTEEEMSGLLNAALDGLERLRENGDFSLPETDEERLEYYEQQSDHIKSFAVNCLTNEASERVKKEDVYNAYTQFCEAEGYEPAKKSTFWSQIRRTTLNVTDIRPELPSGERPRMLDNATFTQYGAKNYAPQFDSEVSTADIESDAVALADINIDDSQGEYVTVTVEVEKDTKASGLSDDDRPVFKGHAQDETGEATVLTWDEHPDASDPDQPLTLWPDVESEESAPVAIRDARVDEYNGELQLVLERGTTKVSEVQVGVGHIAMNDAGDNETLNRQSDVDTQDVESLKPRVVTYIHKTEEDMKDGVPFEMVVGSFATDGEQTDAVIGAIDSALEDGRIYEIAEDRFRTT